MVPRRARGFTYLGLIILLAIMALVAAAGLKMGTLLQRAAAEEELLEIGAQFSEALRSYAAATPPGKPTQPPTLQDLLRDPRFPNPRRHLRKMFVDPVTGKAEWGIIYLGDKVGVLGVYSLSAARPLKIANFDIRFLNMENREKISDWKFLVAGGDGGLGSATTIPPNSMIGQAPPPSMFPSAIANAQSGGKNGLAPAAGAAPGKGNEAPQPVPAQEQDAPVLEEPPPMDPPPEEEKDEEEDDVKPVDPVEQVEPSVIVTPPPLPRARR
ncbi:MAG: type II secretion system protein [Telluria sp.]